MTCSIVLYILPIFFAGNVPTNSTLFSNLDLQEMTKIAMESQLRQDDQDETYRRK